MDKHSDKFNKELENIKKNQLEWKNTITEIKSTLEGINSILNDTEEWISELEDRVVKSPSLNTKKKKRIFKNEDSLRDL